MIGKTCPRTIWAELPSSSSPKRTTTGEKLGSGNPKIAESLKGPLRLSLENIHWSVRLTCQIGRRSEEKFRGLMGWFGRRTGSDRFLEQDLDTLAKYSTFPTDALCLLGYFCFEWYIWMIQRGISQSKSTTHNFETIVSDSKSENFQPICWLFVPPLTLQFKTKLQELRINFRNTIIWWDHWIPPPGLQAAWVLLPA